MVAGRRSSTILLFIQPTNSNNNKQISLTANKDRDRWWFLQRIKIKIKVQAYLFCVQVQFAADRFSNSVTAKPRALFCRGNRICPMLILAFFLVELSRRFENRNCSLCSAASLPFQNSLVGEFLSVLPLSKI